MEPLIPANVKAIHEGFSIATGATFVVGIVTALLAAVAIGRARALRRLAPR
jgi:hypothetical protein